jgi:hypothetical protein
MRWKLKFFIISMMKFKNENDLKNSEKFRDLLSWFFIFRAILQCKWGPIRQKKAIFSIPIVIFYNQSWFFTILFYISDPRNWKLKIPNAIAKRREMNDFDGCIIYIISYIVVCSLQKVELEDKTSKNRGV